MMSSICDRDDRAGMNGNANGWQTTLGVGRGPSANPGWRQPNGLTRQAAFWLVAVSLIGVFLSGAPTAHASLQTRGPWPGPLSCNQWDGLLLDDAVVVNGWYLKS